MAAPGGTNRIGRWPAPGRQPFFLHHAGLLDQQAPCVASAGRDYAADPRHPVPTIGGAIASGAPLMEAGAFDQREAPAFFGSREPYRPLAERDDVLVFQTEPLAADNRSNGPDYGDPVCFQFCTRHRRHGQADRRLPRQRGLAGWLCDEFDAWNFAAALSHQFRKAGAAAAGRHCPDRGRGVSNIQPVRQRPPHPPGYLRAAISRTSTSIRIPARRRARLPIRRSPAIAFTWTGSVHPMSPCPWLPDPASRAHGPFGKSVYARPVGN